LMGCSWSVRNASQCLWLLLKSSKHSEELCPQWVHAGPVKPWGTCKGCDLQDWQHKNDLLGQLYGSSALNMCTKMLKKQFSCWMCLMNCLMDSLLCFLRQLLMKHLCISAASRQKTMSRCKVTRSAKESHILLWGALCSIPCKSVQGLQSTCSARI
jgi:hypothetical protein